MLKIKRPFLAVRAIITNEEGKVLILKRSNTSQGDGRWCLPGGNIEYGQSASEAMAIEIRQETSLTSKNMEFLFILENLPSEETELHYVSLAFECNAEGTVQLNFESSDYAWIGSGDLPDYSIAFKNDEILLKYWHLKN